MKKFKVAVSDYVFPDLKPEEEILSPLGVEILSGQSRSVEELIALTKEADALLNCYFKPVGEEVFRASPRLKTVVRYGIGVDTIDIPAATRYGIMVANIPDYCLEEVSDHTISLIFALSRKIVLSDKKVKEGDYSLSYLKPIFKLQGKTIGFLGFGRIAQMVAKKLANFGLKFIFYDPYLKEDAVEKTQKVSLQEILSSSDYLLVHTPETKETAHLLNRETLSLMKPTACLINTARGGIIDTPALIEMLQSGKLAGAGLDVMEGIPPINPDHLLCKMDNVILTPHSAWYSEDALRELQTKAAQEVARVLSGEKPRSLLNPEVLKTENFKLSL
ncbi:MAG: C-terminal binding protein [Candidatus Omnitrophota bacterium]